MARRREAKGGCLPAVLAVAEVHRAIAEDIVGQLRRNTGL